MYGMLDEWADARAQDLQGGGARDGSMVEEDRVRGETEDAAENECARCRGFLLTVVQPLHLLFLSLSRTHYFLDDLRIVFLHLRIVFP
jgi:hypothetical protein